jgi:hypothetical protein
MRHHPVLEQEISMIPADDFDPSTYMSAPRLDVPSQIALGRQLLALAPPDLPRQAVVAKRQLLAATQALEQGYQAAQGEEPSQAKRPIDQGADNTWACVKSRLDPYTWIDEERFPEAGRAKALARRLFPTGLAFTQLEYGAQWAEASWRLKLIAEEKLEPELRRLCGDMFIDELFHWHKEYGKMVGAVRRGAGGEAKLRPNLAELRRQAGQAVVVWQVQLVALHLSGHQGARAGLRPTDDYRDKLSAGPKTPPEPKVPGGPVPAPPSHPAPLPA